MNQVLAKRNRLRLKAEADSSAALKLARSFGFERPRNYRYEVGWYRRAAKMGNVEAQNLLGECYRDGKGVKRSKHLALLWLKKAAAGGERQAMVVLGKLARH